jgi:hypothetical protein
MRRFINPAQYWDKGDLTSLDQINKALTVIIGGAPVGQGKSAVDFGCPLRWLPEAPNSGHFQRQALAWCIFRAADFVPF